jgi:hypothetical protein
MARAVWSQHNRTITSSKLGVDFKTHCHWGSFTFTAKSDRKRARSLAWPVIGVGRNKIILKEPTFGNISPIVFFFLKSEYTIILVQDPKADFNW